MAKINTAERVSREASDNFVFQRSLLAYHAAAERIAGDVLEIGTGSGYGIEVVAPHARRFTTIDKHIPPQELLARTDVAFRQAVVPPLPFADASFDWVITFQVIEHIRRDGEFVREIHRVLRPGGQLIVTTPNAPMSLTRNPWHVREYTAGELRTLLGESFAAVETLGVFGNAKAMAYYEENRRSVQRLLRFVAGLGAGQPCLREIFLVTHRTFGLQTGLLCLFAGNLLCIHKLCVTIIFLLALLGGKLLGGLLCICRHQI